MHPLICLSMQSILFDLSLGWQSTEPGFDVRSERTQHSVFGTVFVIVSNLNVIFTGRWINLRTTYHPVCVMCILRPCVFGSKHSRQQLHPCWLVVAAVYMHKMPQIQSSLSLIESHLYCVHCTWFCGAVSTCKLIVSARTSTQCKLEWQHKTYAFLFFSIHIHAVWNILKFDVNIETKMFCTKRNSK